MSRNRSEMYRLIAYDVETHGVVLDWPNYGGNPPSAGIPSLNFPPEEFGHRGIRWTVCGTRKDCTAQVLRIDVRKLGAIVDPGEYKRQG
jgi:hypothetical protein